MTAGGRPARGVVAALALAAAVGAGARDLDDAGRLSLRSSLKSTLVVSRFPDDPVLYPERTGADALFRLRLDALAEPTEAWTLQAAWETRLRATAPARSATGGFLPAEAAPPWRLRALDAPLATGDGLSWRHELDRALVSRRAGALEATLGRQAIGWGRGALFGAVDLFAPFSPLEADRAWRRGVDAARAELRLGERLSVEGAAALGVDGDPDASILAGRIRGYAGPADGELVLGRRGRDAVVGATVSAPVGEAEVHLEGALFRTPERSADPLLADGRWTAKAVAGVSYRVPLGQGIAVIAEYHYSGFGAPRPGALPALLADPAWRARLERGDTQIAARQAVALLASWEANEELSAQLLWLASPRDGSGVLSPAATVAIGDRAAVQATAYLPHGAGPRGGVPRTDLGATPLAVLVQLSIQD